MHVGKYTDKVSKGDSDSCWFPKERMGVVNYFNNTGSMRLFRSGTRSNESQFQTHKTGDAQ